jgi:hypothetical protein
LLDTKILPPELAPNDATSGGVLTDEERAPEDMPADPGMAFVAPPAQPVATKAADPLDALLDTTYADALKWARLALAKEG